MKRIACFLLLLLTAQSFAGGFYAGISYDLLGYEKKDAIRSLTPLGDDITYNTLNVAERPAEIFDVDSNLSGLAFRVGYQLNISTSTIWPVALEARAGFGLSGDVLDQYTEDIDTADVNFQILPSGQYGFAATINTDIIPDELELRDYTGLFFRFGGANQKELMGRVSPYVLLGYTWAKFITNSITGTADGRTESASYGVGANVRISKEQKSYLKVEYLQLLDKEDLVVDGWSLGFEYHLF